MRNVFVQCGFIHVFNMVVAWFWTPYFAITLLTAYNAWRTRHLNRSKAALLVVEEQERLQSQLNEVKQVAAQVVNSTPADLKDLGFKLQQILERQ